jgi:histone H3/H4
MEKKQTKKKKVLRKKPLRKKTRKIKYPKKRKNITKAQAKRAVRKVMKKKTIKQKKVRKTLKGVKRIRPRLKRIGKKEKVKRQEEILAPAKKGGSMVQSTINSTGGKKEETMSTVQQVTVPNGKELRDPEKIKVKGSNVLNVAKYVKENTDKKVSTDFVYELVSRLKDEIDTVLHDANIIAEGEKRKTLMEHHLIHAYSHRHPESHRLISCTNCEHSFSIDVSDMPPGNSEGMARILTCPFCQTKRSLIYSCDVP